MAESDGPKPWYATNGGRILATALVSGVTASVAFQISAAMQLTAIATRLAQVEATLSDRLSPAYAAGADQKIADLTRRVERLEQKTGL